MKKKLIIIGAISFSILMSYLLIYNYIIKNINCRGETYKYEMWDTMPINFTKRIESGECECISSDLYINSKIKKFSKQQLLEIRKKLPDWLDKNTKNLSLNDKIDLKELISKSDKDLLEDIKYKYSFIDAKTSAEVYVSKIKVNSIKIYLIDYKNVYYQYFKPSNETNSFKLNLEKERPNFSIIQSEAWIKTQFGEKGI